MFTYSKLLTGLAFGGMLLMYVSCGNSEQNVAEGIEYYPVKLGENGRWGMVSPSGEMLFEDEFENEPTPVLDGLFFVEEGGSQSIYKASKKPELVIGELTQHGLLSEGVIPTTTENSRITMIDRNGKVKFTLMPHNGKEIVGCDGMFFDGLLRIQDEDGKWGYADSDGKIIISPKYRGCTPFSEDFALAAIEKNDENKLIIIDKKGNEVTTLKDDIELGRTTGTGFKHGLLIAKRNDACGFIDTKGEFKKVSGKVHSIGDYNEDLFTYMDKDGKWGVMTFDDNQLIRCKYNRIKILSSGDFLVDVDGEVSVINKADEKILDLHDYTNVLALSGAFNFVAKEGGNYYLFLDKDGKPVNKNEYAKVGGLYFSKDNILEDQIRSDYFDVEGVSQLIAESISEKGIGNNTIGSPMSKYIKNPNDFSSIYISSVEDSTSAKKGYRYSISVNVYGNESALQYGKDPQYGYTDYSKKEINPSAVVERIELTASVKDVSSVKEKVIASLVQKGFEKTSDNELTKGKTVVSIYDSYGDIKIRLFANTANDNASVGNVTIGSDMYLEGDM
ncbi:MAG: WG repeat-containing protein [Muribaculaceae bacterium]|nr:WG repeat-containing protein [Muribaculaceae bacterium]